MSFTCLLFCWIFCDCYTLALCFPFLSHFPMAMWFHNNNISDDCDTLELTLLRSKCSQFLFFFANSSMQLTSIILSSRCLSHLTSWCLRSACIIQHKSICALLYDCAFHSHPVLSFDSLEFMVVNRIFMCFNNRCLSNSIRSGLLGVSRCDFEIYAGFSSSSRCSFAVRYLFFFLWCCHHHLCALIITIRLN